MTKVIEDALGVLKPFWTRGSIKSPDSMDGLKIVQRSIEMREVSVRPIGRMLTPVGVFCPGVASGLGPGGRTIEPTAVVLTCGMGVRIVVSVVVAGVSRVMIVRDLVHEGRSRLVGAPVGSDVVHDRRG